MAYYNEFDPKAAAWLRELAKQGHIAPGVVDDRSIVDVLDIPYGEQCHFFAGIGGWSYALRLAGVPDDALLWTASLPCQPFSITGKRQGFSDDRHLWPTFFDRVRRYHPPILLGEQVGSPDGRDWLLGVFTGLESEGYRVAGADLCSAGAGAPNIRQRIYWGAWLPHAVRQQTQSPNQGGLHPELSRGCLHNDRFSCANSDPRQGRRINDIHEKGRVCPSGHTSRLSAEDERLGHSERCGLDWLTRWRAGRITPDGCQGSDPEWRIWADGTIRRIEPGIRPLAHGVPARVVKLRGYGNAINPHVAAQFITAFLGAVQDQRRSPNVIHLHITVDSVGCNGEEARRFLGGIGVERFNIWVRTGKIKKAARDWYLYEDLVSFANSMRSTTSQPELEVVDITGAIPNPKPRKRAEAGEGDIYLTPAD